jgi:antitoxin MazE
MQVSKWGNSLAVRFPVNLVQALDLKEGEEVDLHLVGDRAFEVSKKPGTKELLARLHQFRGRLPADFHFDRLQANQRDGAA